MAMLMIDFWGWMAGITKGKLQEHCLSKWSSNEIKFFGLEKLKRSQ